MRLLIAVLWGCLFWLAFYFFGWGIGLIINAFVRRKPTSVEMQLNGERAYKLTSQSPISLTLFDGFQLTSEGNIHTISRRLTTEGRDPVGSSTEPQPIDYKKTT